MGKFLIERDNCSFIIVWLNVCQYTQFYAGIVRYFPQKISYHHKHYINIDIQISPKFSQYKAELSGAKIWPLQSGFAPWKLIFNSIWYFYHLLKLMFRKYRYLSWCSLFCIDCFLNPSVIPTPDRLRVWDSNLCKEFSLNPNNTEKEGKYTLCPLIVKI